MGYNVVDIIDKAISIANKRKEIISEKHNPNPSAVVISRVLIKEINKIIEYYEDLKNEIKSCEIEEIDFYTYDKISFLMNSFSNKIKDVNVSSLRDFLKHSLETEKDLYAMFIDVRGRFVNKSSDVNTKTYETLTKIIENKARVIKMLEKSLK